jgi:hypothetical protein
MIEYKKAILSVPIMIARPGDPSTSAEILRRCDFLKAFLPSNENCMEPLSVWLYPIIPDRTIDDVNEFNGVKGMLASGFYWRTLLKDMLPPESRGIILVVSNECVENAFTYQINGPSATYVSSIRSNFVRYMKSIIILKSHLCYR